MPLLSIETNRQIDDKAMPGLLEAASRLTSEKLGKPEGYIMVRAAQNPNMIFAGSKEPLALLRLASIGLSEEATAGLSAALCELVEQYLNVPRARTYIEFVDAPRKMWGYDGRTF
ncbi:MAG: phenylpyruvate tautomerase MIF-related protein [Pseudomonadota bacterium]|nr:phenylpyruvate tautomerase MIF-related protein [Pseudomonadota bacterium]